MTARILTVCTGNVCRSPLAEGLLRAGLEGQPVVVESAGTHAVDGDRASPETLELGRRLGLNNLELHRARSLTEQLLEGVDLVLTMTTTHTETVVRLAPGLVNHTFTIRELAALTGSTESVERAASDAETRGDASELTRRVARAASSRRGSVVLSAEQLDVSDPYRRGVEAYERSATELVPAVRTAVALLRASLEAGP